jgi:hypothetical protein
MGPPVASPLTINTGLLKASSGEEKDALRLGKGTAEGRRRRTCQNDSRRLASFDEDLVFGSCSLRARLWPRSPSALKVTRLSRRLAMPE